MANILNSGTVMKDGIKYGVSIKRTGNDMPQPARIRVSYEYWDDTGGWRGWESKCIYDRDFEDWDYAYALFYKILSRGDKQ